jgi:hypothetical protein
MTITDNEQDIILCSNCSILDQYLQKFIDDRRTRHDLRVNMTIPVPLPDDFFSIRL